MILHLLKLREASRALGVHRHTLGDYMQKRKIAFVVMPGGQKRISEDELRRFAESRTVNRKETDHHE
jgi:excisionase family DNA binding protein